MAALHTGGLSTAMITGDNARTARAVAQQVEAVKRLQARFGRVVFVGEGIAEIAMAGSSVTVVGNANLLKRRDLGTEGQREKGE